MTKTAWIAGFVLALATAAGLSGWHTAAAGPSGVPGGATATPTASACAPWQVVPSGTVAGQDSLLYGASAAAWSDAWVVGTFRDPSFHQETLIDHWDGATWSVVGSPNPGASNNLLFGAAALSASDAWAVGWKASTNIPQPLFLHWDGTAWTEAATSLARPQVVLFGIAAHSATDIWAVGQSCETPACLRHITATVHWDGTTWTVVDSPNPSAYDNGFNAVAVDADGHAWAVGEACADAGCGTSQTLIERWDGTAWTVSPAPSPGSARTDLLGVAAAGSGDAWAVGEACADGGCAAAQAAALHWDGTNWTAVPAPNPGSQDTHLNAVTLGASGEAWAAGSATNDGSTYANALLHWDGSAWSLADVTSPGTGDNDLRAFAAVARDDIWVAGDSQSGSGPEVTQVQHYTGPCIPPTGTPGAPSATATATSTATAVAPSPTPAPPSSTATPTAAAPTSTPRVPTATAVPATATPLPPSATPPPSTPPAPPTTTPCTLAFADVHPTDYFYAPVTYLACGGVISGYADGTFRPYALTTRGQLSKIVVLAEGWAIVTPTGTPTFRDVPAGNAFYPFVETAVAHGIISGYDCGPACREFRWGADVTRSQLAKIVVLAAGWAITEPPQPTFQDVPASDPFFGTVETAYAHGILSGYTCGTGCLVFRPGNPATRGQIAKIVYNAVTGP